MSSSTQVLKLHIRTIGQLAEVVGALSKEFERQPRPEILVTLKTKVEALGKEWEKAEAILAGKSE